VTDHKFKLLIKSGVLSLMYSAIVNIYKSADKLLCSLETAVSKVYFLKHCVWRIGMDMSNHSWLFN